MHILVVDDDDATQPLLLQHFKEEMQRQRFRFSFARSIEEALACMKEAERPAALLILTACDNGLELLKTIKTQYPESAVMMVTTYDDAVHHNQAIAYRADGFINKPIDCAALREKLLKLAASTQQPERCSPANKILVVDEGADLEVMIKQKFRHQIKDGEMTFTFAPDGVKALELIHEDPEIGIVITTIEMAEMDGLTLLAHLQKMERLFRYVIISTYGDMDNIRSAMNLGASDFITTPIDLMDLEVALHRLITQYDSLKHAANERDTAIAYNKEIEISQHIQKSGVPPQIPDNSQIEIFGKVYPAHETCGDFYDFFLIGKDQLGFVIADVSGRGIPAALFMVSSQTLLRSAALTSHSPAECLRAVNHYLCDHNESMMYVTAAYGILNINSGMVTLCDAGHLPPYLLSSSGTLRRLEKKGGVALGVIDDLGNERSIYQEQTIQLHEGDAIIFYSDGITEMMDSAHNTYPLSRFETTISDNSREAFPLFAKNLYCDLYHFSQGTRQYDDITLLCLRWNG